MPTRRTVVVAAAAAALPPIAFAHHGWSGFDQDRPLYLEGSAESVVWRNPHVELRLRLATALRLPPDLAARSMPAQTAPVDAPKLLAATKLPTRKDAVWEVELAPLTRMGDWKVAEIKAGQGVAVVGYAAPGERGEAVLRAEFLWVDGKAYALRSSPA